MIEICSLSVSYGKTKVLSDISLTVPNGKITVAAGLNGCGKTTLLRSVAGLMPYSGTVKVDGTDVNSLGRRETSKKIAYLAQMKTPSDLTVFRTVLCGRYPHLPFPHIFTQSDRDIAESAVKTMYLSDVADKKTSQLSGGLLQKTGIAMILAQQAGNILLDEPTANLDYENQISIHEKLDELKREDKGILFSTHNPSEALEFADEILILDDRKLIFSGGREEAYEEKVFERLYEGKIKVMGLNDGGKNRYVCLRA